MSSCRVAERGLIETMRGSASDAARLELDAHLAECPSCRDSRKAFGLLGALKAAPAPALGAAAESRVLRNLVVHRGQGTRLVERRGWRSRAALVGGAFALAVVALAAGVGRQWRGSSSTGQGVVASAVGEGERLEAARAGVVSFAGSSVTYQPGAVMAFFPSTRTVRLDAGEIDVDVTEHGPTHFRVVTSRFIVDVPGTRFVVSPLGARTVRGLVRILDPSGRELAQVAAGSSWTAPSVEAASPVVGETSPAPADAPMPPAAPAPVAARSAATASAPGPVRSEDITALLEKARGALVVGDATRARGLLDRAIAAHPRRAARPAIDLLMADSWLVARRPDEALAAYRSVAQRHPGAPEGETAAFTVSQLLLERGATVEARAALGDYLARYPRGRFVREARERLAPVDRPIR